MQLLFRIIDLGFPSTVIFSSSDCVLLNSVLVFPILNFLWVFYIKKKHNTKTGLMLPYYLLGCKAPSNILSTLVLFLNTNVCYFRPRFRASWSNHNNSKLAQVEFEREDSVFIIFYIAVLFFLYYN